MSKLDIKHLKELLVSKLLSKGFTIKESYKVKGFSGVTHEFDLLIIKENNCCAVNFCKTEVAIELIKAVALYLDTKIPQIIVCKEFKKNLVKMIEGSGIKVSIFSHSDVDEIVEKIMLILENQRKTR